MMKTFNSAVSTGPNTTNLTKTPSKNLINIIFIIYIQIELKAGVLLNICLNNEKNTRSITEIFEQLFVFAAQEWNLELKQKSLF